VADTEAILADPLADVAEDAALFALVNASPALVVAVDADPLAEVALDDASDALVVAIPACAVAVAAELAEFVADVAELVAEVDASDALVVATVAEMLALYADDEALPSEAAALNAAKIVSGFTSPISPFTPIGAILSSTVKLLSVTATSTEFSVTGRISTANVILSPVQ
jgi:hypothetical protein